MSGLAASGDHPVHASTQGKVERYNRILSKEFLCARTWTSDGQRREALGTCNVHYNYHRPHSAADGEPPASRLKAGISNVLASYI